MNCTNCGTLLPDGVAFCPQCGQKVEKPVEEIVATVEEIVAPVEETIAPTEEIVAPAEETVAPVEEIVAPAEETIAPAEEIVAPAEETVAPVEEIVAPVEEIVAPVEEIVAPVEETIAPAEEIVAPVENVITQPQVQQPAQAQPFVGNVMPPEKPANSKKKLFILLGAAAAAVLVVVLILLNLNSLSKLFSSPEKYYAKIEKKNLGETMLSLADIYEYSMDYVSIANKGYEIDMEANLSEDAREMLADLMKVDDCDAFAKASAAFRFYMKKDSISAKLSTALGKTTILSADAVADLSEGKAYAQIPELSKTYIGVDIDSFTDDIKDAFENNAEAAKLFPTKKRIIKVLKPYLDIVFDHVTNVSDKKDTVTVGDIEKKATAYRVRLKPSDQKKIVQAVYEKAYEDEELLTLFAEFAYAIDYLEGNDKEDIEDYVESIKDYLDYELEKMDDDRSPFDRESCASYVMTVWIDGKGNIIGRKLMVDENEVFSYQMPKKGSKFELSLSIIDKGIWETTEYIISGSGTEGSSLSGDFELKINDGYDTSKLVEVSVDKLNLGKLKKGFINGSFNLKPSKELLRQANIGVASSIVSKYSLQLDLEQNKNKSKTKITLLDDEDEFASLRLNGTVTSGKSASLPKKGILVEDGDDLMEWYDTLDFSQFLKTLKKVGLPVELLDKIEDGIDTLEKSLKYISPKSIPLF